MKKEEAIAIIPARGGSKRIPLKNIKPFLGKPIISYSINAALESGIFKDVMVSTDSEEIANISRISGASVPFMRNAETANDYAVLADVVMEVLKGYQSTGRSFSYACCILPTAPLIRISHLLNGLKMLKERRYDSVIPFKRFAHPILRSFKLSEGRVEMNWPEYINTRSQDLPPSFHDAGQFYWLRIASFMENGAIFTSNSGGIELEELETQDIDNESDWLIAEIKYKILNNEFQDLTNKG